MPENDGETNFTAIPPAFLVSITRLCSISFSRIGITSFLLGCRSLKVVPQTFLKGIFSIFQP